jgi:hypothetical protein
MEFRGNERPRGKSFPELEIRLLSYNFSYLEISMEEYFQLIGGRIDAEPEEVSVDEDRDQEQEEEEEVVTIGPGRRKRGRVAKV